MTDKASSFLTGPEPLGQLGAYLDEHPAVPKVIVTDANTQEFCYPLLAQKAPVLKNAYHFQIPDGESSKTLHTCERLWAYLLANHFDRDTLLINLGGGMLCDLGGFAAAVFKRGIPFIHIPTTLLAMTDAAIGGKTGVNFNGYKNQLGTFTVPEKTVIYTDFLRTLDDRLFRSGFAEMLKHGLIGSKKLWDVLSDLKTLSLEAITPHLWPSIKVKQTLAEKDRLESGERKKLNFGHTIGHALESYSLDQDADPLFHGEAVAMGMLVESQIAYEMGYLEASPLKAIGQAISHHFPLYEFPGKAMDQIWHYMQSDKKNAAAGINFTLITEPGHSIVDCYPDEMVIQQALEKTLIPH